MQGCDKDTFESITWESSRKAEGASWGSGISSVVSERTSDKQAHPFCPKRSHFKPTRGRDLKTGRLAGLGYPTARLWLVQKNNKKKNDNRLWANHREPLGPTAEGGAFAAIVIQYLDWSFPFSSER